jgi:hypothetical protein
MRCIAHVAAKDYNSKIESIKKASNTNSQDTIVSVVECGHGRTASVKRVITNSNVNTLTPITSYVCDGPGTPLFDSVGDLIEQFESVPDYDDASVSFLVMAITDGYENYSQKYDATKLAKKIRELTATDRWTFVFRVPRGHAGSLARLGIPSGNILEWDQTERGVAVAAQRDEEAFTEYFTQRSSGMKSTGKFYADLSNISEKEIKEALVDVSNKVTIWPVASNENDTQIKPFIEKRLGREMVKGAGFYQLTKTEPVVQDYKKILIRDKSSQAVYEGAAARQMLGLPTYGNIRLAPGSHGNYDIFIQSTSVNRKLKAGTSLVYYEN